MASVKSILFLFGKPANLYLPQCFVFQGYVPNSMVYTPHPDLMCKLIVQPGMACAHLVYCCHSSSVIGHEFNMFP